jgi:hypothetical protein
MDRSVWWRRKLTSGQLGSRRKKGYGMTGVSFQYTPPVTYFLHLGPTSSFPPHMNAIIVQIHHRINPVMIQSLPQSPTSEHCCTENPVFNT